jgi:uncharacterized membrane protein YqhA
MSRLLSLSRYLALIPVFCIFLAAAALLIYGALLTGQMLFALFTTGSIDTTQSKALLVRSIELADLFLLATVLYVMAVGLYELFIDDTVGLPAWLEIHNLDDLKDKLIGVVIVVLGVVFLGQVITWDGERDLLSFGAAVGLVIAALAYFVSQKTTKGGKPKL